MAQKKSVPPLLPHRQKYVPPHTARMAPAPNAAIASVNGVSARIASNAHAWSARKLDRVHRIRPKSAAMSARFGCRAPFLLR